MAEEKYVSGETFREMHREKLNQPRGPILNRQKIAWTGLIIVLCLISFMGGINYQKHSAKTSLALSGLSNQFTGTRRAGGFGQVSAIASDSVSIINARSGVTTTYAITPNTVITDAGQATDFTDIKAGENVMIGTSNTDNTTATTILVNASFSRPTATPTN